MKTLELAELIKAAVDEAKADGVPITALASLAHNVNYTLSNSKSRHNERRFLSACGF